MKKTRIFLVLLAFLLFRTIFGQTNEADSLKKVITSSLPDTIKLKALSDLNWIYSENDAQLSKKYGEDELALARKISDNKWISQAYNDIGIAFYKLNKPDSALVYYTKSYEIRKNFKDKTLMGGSLSKIGLIHQDLGNYNKALEIQFQALKIFEEIGNERYLAMTLNNIAIAYDKLKNFDKEIEYVEKAIAIHLKNKNEYYIGHCYGNLASAYKNKGNIKVANEYLIKALEIFKKYGDKANEAAAYNSIGRNLRAEKKIDEAYSYYEKAHAIAKEINDKMGERIYAHNMSCVLTDKKEYKQAEKFSLDVLNQTQPNDHSQLALTYRQLATIYGFMNNGELAKHYLDKYVDLKDTVFSKESASQIAEMEVKYETEKKDLELAKQNAEITVTKAEVERKNIITYILVASILLIILLSYLIYNRYKLKQEAILSSELLRQQDLRSKAIIEAEENERMRIARDLHDGVGQTLSAAKLNLSSLENKLKLTEVESQSALKNAMDLVDDSVKEVRSVSHSMMPNALLKSGLVAAVREFINKLSGIDKLKIDLEITGLDQRLESTTETILFRVLQEVISNILKHAKANHITIQLVKHETELTMIIEDNGVGFDTKKMSESAGIGLKNITSRIEFLQGRVDFDSNPGKGTTVIIEVPVK
ncbi:MAG: tetratricopeptide repeat protein [Bacteroidetes bacterium]|jgi:signal transduction histidine kinase|nr:tetratricopeptide repeat protein [Bacteroidota bacterium]